MKFMIFRNIFRIYGKHSRRYKGIAKKFSRRIIDNHADFFNDNKNLEASPAQCMLYCQFVRKPGASRDILENYPVSYLDNLNSKNYKGAIQTIQLLSASLRDTYVQW